MEPIRYDFTKPSSLFADTQQRFTSWLRATLPLINKSWSKQLPIALEASFVEQELCYARDALRNLPEGTVGYCVQGAGERLPSMVVLPRILLLRLVGAMLADKTAELQDCELTLIEENLAEYFLAQNWLPHFKESWPGSERILWILHPRDVNPQNSRFFAESDALAALEFQVRGPWGEWNFRWFFAKQGLNDVLGNGKGSPVALSAPALQARREAAVNQLPMQLEVTLGSTDVSLSQLASLQTGDVILLDQGFAQDVIVRSGGRTVFRAKPGRVGSRKAFRIEAIDGN
jgi:flagellar motor switch protein FliM